MTITTIRAFNGEGYHRDIAVISGRQVHMHDSRCEEPESSCMTGLIGHGVRIDPKDFPEMAYFEIVVRENEK